MTPLSHNDFGERSLDRRSALAVVAVVLIAFLVAASIVVFFLLTIGTVLTSYQGGLSALNSSAHPPAWASVLTLVGLWSGYVGGFFVARRIAPGPRLKKLFAVRASDVLYIVVGVGLQFAVVVAYAPFHLRHFSAPTDKLFSGTSGAGFALLCILTGLVVPFFEELFFRATLIPGLLGLLRVDSSRVTVALVVVVDGALFGLAHGELAQLAGLAVVGSVLAYIFIRSGRLAPSVFVHAAFNSTALFSIIFHRVS